MTITITREEHQVQRAIDDTAGALYKFADVYMKLFPNVKDWDLYVLGVTKFARRWYGVCFKRQEPGRPQQSTKRKAY